MNEENYTPEDFSIEDDFKPEPLIPRGIYHGAATNLIYNMEKCYLMWEITLADNGGVMSDGDTPIDGAKLYYFNYLPKKGDREEMTKSGRYTKFQWKVNDLAKFAETFGISKELGSLAAIEEFIDNQEFLGLDVDAQIIIDDYNGNISNKVDRLLPAAK